LSNESELCVTPIDFLVFGLKVIGGACGLPFTSLAEVLAVTAKTALIYCCVKKLLALGLP